MCLIKDKQLTKKFKITKANVDALFPDIQWGDPVMSKGFDIDFEGLDMDPDQVQRFLTQKRLKYQKSNLFAIKTMDGTENVVSKMIEANEEGF